MISKNRLRWVWNLVVVLQETNEWAKHEKRSQWKGQGQLRAVGGEVVEDAAAAAASD